MDLHSRRAFVDAMAERYRRARRRSKTRILDEVCEATGYHRKYAIRQIRRIEQCGRPEERVPRKRKRYYGPEVLDILEDLWKEAGYPWSVRLKAILPIWLPAMRLRHGRKLTAAVESDLLRMSPRTIDRALAGKKRERRKRLYGRTKPGTLLRHHIPIKCEHWDVGRAGYLELDTVAHCGNNAAGLFAYSLNLTDIASTWVESRCVLGKGEVVVRGAFSEMSDELPFEVVAIDSDNGGEFINHHLYHHCESRHIDFTRSRPYKKDDNAHIEQKNWTHVRKLIGWDRYESEQAVRTINELYRDELRIYMNLFQPSVKLIRTVRRGSSKTRHYDQPRTPLDRLADLPGAKREKVQQLFELRARLDPFALSAAIRKKLDRIWKLRHVGRISTRQSRSQRVTDTDVSRSLTRTIDRSRRPTRTP